MIEKNLAIELRASFDQFAADTAAYFAEAREALVSVQRPDKDVFSWQQVERDYFWGKLSEPLQASAVALVGRILSLSGQLAPLVKSAPLASEGDQRTLMAETKTIRSALLLRRFRQWNAVSIHDSQHHLVRAVAS